MDSDEITEPNPDGWFYDRDAKEWRCVLWADNWPAMKLYTSNATQWRTGMNGPTGLDYNVFFREIDRMGLSKDDADDMMGCIREMERTVLDMK